MSRIRRTYGAGSSGIPSSNNVGGPSLSRGPPNTSARNNISRNAAARDAQRRLQQMMIGQSEDEDDYGDGGDAYHGGGSLYAAPAPAGRVPHRQLDHSLSQGGRAQGRVQGGSGYREPPVNPNLAAYQGPPSPDSGSGSYTSAGRGGRYGGDEYGASRESEQLKREVSRLQDDYDLLETEHEILREKLSDAEVQLRASQKRCQDLENQVANLGGAGGGSMESRYLQKKEAALKLREAALKAAAEQNRDVTETELNNLRLEAEAAREEAMMAEEEKRKAESEMEQIRQMTARLILTPEEKEEVVLKRCWLARYWLLAKHYGIHAEVASPQADTWQSYAALPMEVVQAAGLKAREEPSSASKDAAINDASSLNLRDLNSDINIESMFQVEKGLRDLSSLKVEEAVVMAMASHHRPALIRVGSHDPSAPGANPGDVPRFQESVDLSEEEVDDVRFKQNWLVYFWRRAKTAGVELDIAEERLQYWIARTNFQPKAHDAVDAERGITEIRKLGLERQLWEHSRNVAAAEVIAMRSSVSPAMSPSS